MLNERLDEFSQQEDDLAVPVADVDHLLEELLVLTLLDCEVVLSLL